MLASLARRCWMIAGRLGRLRRTRVNAERGASGHGRDGAGVARTRELRGIAEEPAPMKQSQPPSSERGICCPKCGCNNAWVP